MNQTQLTPIVSGAFVFWDCSETEHEVLHAKLSMLGLEKFAPARRTDQACLKKALQGFATLEKKKLPRNKRKGEDKVKRDIIVQPHADKTEGFEVVLAERHTATAGNEYRRLISAKAEKGAVEVIANYTDNGSWSLRDLLQGDFNTYKRLVGGSAVGRCLVDIMAHLHGTCVRTVGGLYYLPEGAVETWDDVVESVEAAGSKNTVHRVKIVMDDAAIKAVKQAIVKELNTASAQIVEEIKAGNLKEETLAARKAKALELRERCREYESILNTELSECHAIIGVAETAASSAKAIQEDDQVFDGLYLQTA